MNRKKVKNLKKVRAPKYLGEVHIPEVIYEESWRNCVESLNRECKASHVVTMDLQKPITYGKKRPEIAVGKAASKVERPVRGTPVDGPGGKRKKKETSVTGKCGCKIYRSQLTQQLSRRRPLHLKLGEREIHRKTVKWGQTG